MLRKTKTAILSLISAAVLCSCSQTAEPPKSDTAAYNRDVFAMDTYMSMKAYGENAEKALEDSEALILRLESELSVTDENSFIHKLNSSENGTAQVSDSAAEIIAKALEIGKKTDGALDITLYPLLKEWGFTTGDYKVPDKDVIDSILAGTGWENVSLSGNTVTIPEGYQVDLGALAKGYTSDSIISQMRTDGVDSAVVSLGGNVQALGEKPDGSAWRVSVRDPFAPDTDMCIVEVRDKAVITSGNYERFFTDDSGKSYWHILDPEDGCPADNGLVSVTIIGDSGLDCDALSTALFVMGKDKAVEYQRREGNFDMILVTDDKHILYTSGIDFTNISSMDAEVLSLD